MEQPELVRLGLYYPFIQFRNDSWLKLAALYWDRIGRIVPPGYQLQDSDTVTFSFAHRRDQSVGQADRPHSPAAPQGGLDLKRASPVLIVGG